MGFLSGGHTAWTCVVHMRDAHERSMSPSKTSSSSRTPFPSFVQDSDTSTSNSPCIMLSVGRTLPQFCSLLPYILLQAFVSATLTNVTIDDSDLAVLYSPPWNYGPTCTVCTSKPDAQQAYMHTWHDVTYDPTITSKATPQTASIVFEGTQLIHDIL